MLSGMEQDPQEEMDINVYDVLQLCFQIQNLVKLILLSSKRVRGYLSYREKTMCIPFRVLVEKQCLTSVPILPPYLPL
jgi:hypothetical protein